ncbi:MAG TPA: hypothetical protein VFX51_26060 [Solirubrobacteraceae bacterium]|nr:hypothetical protein [Solirubrobacteraceae bacterium]
MPTRADIEAATPKCIFAARTQFHFGRLAPAPAPCTSLLRWDHVGGHWVCPAHGAALTGETAGARLAA